MRISDWSSDVCSSDLSCPSLSQCPLAPPVPRRSGQGRAASDVPRALWDRLEGLPCWRRPPWRFYPAGGSPLWAESSLPHSAHEPGFPDSIRPAQRREDRDNKGTERDCSPVAPGREPVGGEKGRARGGDRGGQ